MNFPVILFAVRYRIKKKYTPVVGKQKKNEEITREQYYIGG